MQFDGKLVKWNDERGFGFIAAAQSGQEIFVHISSFSRDGSRPVVGELLSFQVEPGKDGRKRAIHVQRPGRPAQRQRSRGSHAASGRTGKFFQRIVLAVILIALAAYAYKQYSPRTGTYSPIKVGSSPESKIGPAPEPLSAPQQSPKGVDLHCDGRTACSQMTSCTEAKFFLRNCPDTQMDGNHDGVPCEQQWCTSPSAK